MPRRDEHPEQTIVWKEYRKPDSNFCTNTTHCLIHEPTGIDCRDDTAFWPKSSRTRNTRAIRIRK